MKNKHVLVILKKVQYSKSLILIFHIFHLPSSIHFPKTTPRHFPKRHQALVERHQRRPWARCMSWNFVVSSVMGDPQSHRFQYNKSKICIKWLGWFGATRHGNLPKSGQRVWIWDDLDRWNDSIGPEIAQPFRWVKYYTYPDGQECYLYVISMAKLGWW